MKNLKVILIVMIAGALSMSLEAKKVDLKYNLEKGMEFSFESKMTQEIGQEVMGQIQETNSEITTVTKFLVKDINSEGNYVIERQVMKYSMTMGSAMGDIEFDSETIDQDNPAYEAMNAITKMPVTVIMSPKGKVIDVVDHEVMAAKIQEMMSNNGPETQILAGILSGYSSKESVIQATETLLLGFPEGKIKKGNSWEGESYLQQMVNFHNVSTTTLNQVNGDVANLVQEVKISVADGGNTMEMQGMEMEYQMEGNKTGSFEVDMKTGLVTKAEGVTTISGVISVDSPQLPAPMTIPMTIKNTEKTTRL